MHVQWYETGAAEPSVFIDLMIDEVLNIDIPLHMETGTNVYSLVLERFWPSVTQFIATQEERPDERPEDWRHNWQGQIDYIPSEYAGRNGHFELVYWKE